MIYVEAERLKQHRPKYNNLCVLAMETTVLTIQRIVFLSVQIHETIIAARTIFFRINHYCRHVGNKKKLFGCSSQVIIYTFS